MALKDLKSDLSKFRRPIEKPLSDKKRVDVPKSTNQTPLSQFVDNAPNAPKSNTTTPKQGVTPSKFDNSSKHLGEVTPSKFDNSSNYLGETTPSKMSLEERFLGQTETTEVNQGDKFKGETETTNITQGDRFKGQTTPQDYSSEEKFKGETTTTEFRFTQQFLGETTPTEFSLTEKFLGETTPTEFNSEEKFLGETTPTEFNLEEKFLGETTPADFDLSEKFLGETTPTEVNYITDVHAKGFTSEFNRMDDSKFTGITSPKEFNQNSSKFSNFKTGFTTNEESKKTEFVVELSKYSDFQKINPGLSFEAGYGQFKTGGVTGDTQKYTPDGNRYSDVYKSIGDMMEQRNSPSFLDKMYHKFNLKDDSPNSLNIIKAPYILRGIQRKKISKGEPQFWDFGLGIDDGLIRGGIVASTTRALVDVARIGSFFLSAKGLLWGVRQIGLQRSQKYGKTWTPVNLLASLAGQHLGLKFDRPDLIPLGKQGWKYNPNASINVSPLRTLYSVFRLKGIRDDVFPLRVDLKGGFDSIYGIGATTTNRFINTFDNSGTRYGNSVAYLGLENRFSIGPTSPYAKKKKDNPVLFAKKRYEFQINDSLRENDDGTKTTLAKQTQEASRIPIDEKFENIGLYKSDGKTKGPGNDIKDYEAISYGTIAKIANGDNPSDYKGDFRNLKDSNYNIDSATVAGDDYATNNLITKYGLGQTFKTNAERLSETRLDTIGTANVGDAELDDIVKLVFKTNSSNLCQFRGTVSGITETFSPSWNGEKPNGRADKAYMMTEFERTLSFNFKVMAYSKAELVPMWEKLKQLATFAMPFYGSSTGYRGRVLSFTLGDLWKNHNSLLTSLSYTMSDEVSWDIRKDITIPRFVDVSVGLTLVGDAVHSENSTANLYDFVPPLPGPTAPLSSGDDLGQGQQLNLG